MWSSMIVLLFFFFQAEDGIRDGHVTGVQTCALPICRLGSLQQLAIVLGIFTALLSNALLAAVAGGSAEQLWLGVDAWRWMFMIEAVRSEERRVGKECRSRGSA